VLLVVAVVAAVVVIGRGVSWGMVVAAPVVVVVTRGSGALAYINAISLVSSLQLLNKHSCQAE